jgi:hypothetical protein
MRRLSVFIGMAVVMSPAWGQFNAGSASVEGYVLDPSGQSIPGANLKFRNVDTGYQRNLNSNAEGRYAAQTLAVGQYVIEASAIGFTNARIEGLKLQVGRTEKIDIKMQIASVADVAFVTQEAPAIAIESASAVVINTRSVSDLPIRGRNFTEFVQLAPAIVQETDRFGLVISGQRSINSNIAVDGADFNDALQGNQRGGNEAVFFFPQTAIREFQVVNSGAGAEIGRTGGGFVNAVTKSGTNDLHGEAFYFNRNASMTSPDAFNGTLDNAQNQFGGSLGGPLKKDTAFFFVAAEQNFLRVPFAVKFQPQAANVTVPQNLLALEGPFAGTNNPTAIFGKVDYALKNANTLTVQYTHTQHRGTNFDYASSVRNSAVSSNYTRDGQGDAVKANLVSIITPRLLNEARWQWATDNRFESPNVSATQIAITGFGTIGGDRDRPRLFETSRLQGTDNLSWSAGRHQLRVGTDYNHNNVRQQREQNMQGRYDFKSLSDYIAGKINRFRQTLPSANPEDLLFTGAQNELALFVQDRISIRRNISISAGLRWEGQWNPQPRRPNPAFPQTALIPNDLRMWQPRLGFTWSPGQSGATVIRLFSGVFDARTPATLFARVSTDNGVSAISIDSKTDPETLKLLKFPGQFAGLPSGIATPAQRIFGFDPNFRNPVTVQTTAGVEQLITSELSLSATYIHSSASHLQRRLDRNLFPPTFDSFGMPIYPTGRPNPTIDMLSINESTANSGYNAMTVMVSKRFGSRYQFQTSYTLARNIDDDSNERNYRREGALTPFNLKLDRSYSKQDVRHNFNINGYVDVGRGINVGAIMIVHSGMPYNPIIGFDTQNDGNDENDRAIINGRVADRFSMRQPAFYDLDLRVFKGFHLTDKIRFDVIAEGLNVTAAKNKNFGPDSESAFGTPSAPIATAGQALYAPSTARFGGPRQVQLGIRAVF